VISVERQSAQGAGRRLLPAARLWCREAVNGLCPESPKSASRVSSSACRGAAEDGLPGEHRSWLLGVCTGSSSVWKITMVCDWAENPAPVTFSTTKLLGFKLRNVFKTSEYDLPCVGKDLPRSELFTWVFLRQCGSSAPRTCACCWLSLRG